MPCISRASCKFSLLVDYLCHTLNNTHARPYKPRQISESKPARVFKRRPFLWNWVSHYALNNKSIYDYNYGLWLIFHAYRETRSLFYIKCSSASLALLRSIALLVTGWRMPYFCLDYILNRSIEYLTECSRFLSVSTTSEFVFGLSDISFSGVVIVLFKLSTISSV
jgi:hypothetical protein